MRRCRAPMLVLAVLLGALVPSGAASGFPQGPSVPYKTILAGRSSHITEPATMVVRDQAAWIALWRRHTGTDHGMPPAVDFAHDMVVAVFGGASTEPTTAGIVRITHEPKGLVVWYSVQAHRPGPPGEITSSPFQIVKLARSTLPVTFYFLKTQELLRQQP